LVIVTALTSASTVALVDPSVVVAWYRVSRSGRARNENEPSAAVVVEARTVKPA
jgi:hypothetical protein